MCFACRLPWGWTCSLFTAKTRLRPSWRRPVSPTIPPLTPPKSTQAASPAEISTMTIWLAKKNTKNTTLVKVSVPDAHDSWSTFMIALTLQAPSKISKCSKRCGSTILRLLSVRNRRQMQVFLTIYSAAWTRDPPVLTPQPPLMPPSTQVTMQNNQTCLLLCLNQPTIVKLKGKLYHRAYQKQRVSELSW